jgi:acetyltransferase EpsM
MSESLVLVGGGEHARVVLEAARSQPDRWVVAGFIDPLPCAPMQALGVTWLGDDQAAIAAGLSSHFLIVGVGAVGVSAVRQKLVERYQAAGARWATVVHRAAVISPSAQLAGGVAVLAGAVLNAGARAGGHAIVNTGAIVEHDVELGAFVHVGPRAAIGGGAAIGEGSYLGLGSLVRDHVRVGAQVTVGMGAVVVGPVGDGRTVVGVPARER